MIALCVAGCFISFAVGVNVGYRHRDERITQKINKLHSLVEQVKQKNNEFLENISKTYNKIYGTEGQFTEIDDFLMDMWME